MVHYVAASYNHLSYYKCSFETVYPRDLLA